MLDFLKKLFSTKPANDAEIEKIGIDEIEKWFTNKAKSSAMGLERDIKEIVFNIKQEILDAKENISVLLAASLHNPKISIREGQFMEGNRSSYALAVNNFLRMIELDNKSYDELIKACDDFAFRLDKFGRNTIRPYHILQEFFANESRDIAINIKNLERSMLKLKKSISDSKVNRVSEIMETINELQIKRNAEKELKDSMDSSLKLKEGLVNGKVETEKKLQELIKGKEYKALLELKSEKGAISHSIREIENMMLNTFSVIERPLRKLNRILAEDNAILEKYLENPVNALLLDNELKVAGIINNLEDNINNLTLDLKDKKREKVLSCIKAVNREFLSGFQDRHSKLTSKLKELEGKINMNGAFKEEKKLKFDIGIAEDNLIKVNNEIENYEASLGKINLDNMKKELSIKINEMLGTNIEVI